MMIGEDEIHVIITQAATQDMNQIVAVIITITIIIIVATIIEIDRGMIDQLADQETTEIMIGIVI